MTLEQELERVGTLNWARKTGGRIDTAERDAIQRANVAYQAQAMAAADKDFSDAMRRMDLDAIAVPDSRLAKAAEAYVASVSPQSLTDHCHRTFLWGALLAQADETPIADMEVFYLASLLHDLSCTEAHNHKLPGVHCFAVESALSAETYLADNGLEPARVSVAAEAISLHVNTWGIAADRGAVAVYLRYGAACDVVGERAREIPPAVSQDVLRRHPGGDFAAMIGGFLQREIAARPDSRIAVMMGRMMERQDQPPALFPWG
jgi:hypothetical protein